MLFNYNKQIVNAFNYHLPALFDTTVRSLAPCSKIAAISFSGMPHKPNPPTNNLAPLGISLTASAALSNIFLVVPLLSVEYLHTRI